MVNRLFKKRLDGFDHTILEMAVFLYAHSGSFVSAFCVVISATTNLSYRLNCWSAEIMLTKVTDNGLSINYIVWRLIIL